MGNQLLTFIMQQCDSLTATMSPSVDAIGLHIVLSLATIMLVWFTASKPRLGASAKKAQRRSARKPAEPRALSSNMPLAPVVIAPAALVKRHYAAFLPVTSPSQRSDFPTDGTLDTLVRDLRSRRFDAVLHRN